LHTAVEVLDLREWERRERNKREKEEECAGMRRRTDGERRGRVCV